MLAYLKAFKDLFKLVLKVGDVWNDYKVVSHYKKKRKTTERLRLKLEDKEITDNDRLKILDHLDTIG